MKPFVLGRRPLDVTSLRDIACEGRPVELAAEAGDRLRASREVVVEALASDQVVYGINTGFGALSQVRIDADQLATLQLNLLRSHAAGVGPALSRDEVRALLLLRASALVQGYSGVRVELVQRLLDLLNLDALPVVPEQGSCGASGDLAPLAHAALPLIGEGRLVYGGREGPAGEILSELGLRPLTLEPKEGLALINGTPVMTAIGALVLDRALVLARTADVIGALTLDAQLGTDRAFDPRIHRARPHPGQIAVADNLVRLIAGSEIRASHEDCDRVQDAYSLRCMPQVHGALQDVLAHVGEVLEREMNSATDNPLVFPGDDAAVLSGGNFHGEPVALALDYLAMGVAELGAISERRIERMVNPALSRLPAFLAGDPGLESGMMMAQVTAAALVCENASSCMPVSVQSLPTSANQEDHISMGPAAARKARRVVDNVENILAIELLCAVRGIEFRRPLRSSAALEAVVAELRRHVPHRRGDRVLAGEIARARSLIRSGRIAAVAEAEVGPLAPRVGRTLGDSS